MSDYSPHIDTSFDPAIHLHSELAVQSDSHASLSYSDELEALQQCIEETRALKNRAGVVIQHRAWRTADVFRSEEEYPIDTPLKRLNNSSAAYCPSGLSADGHIFPSSPPCIMPLISSPITYPPISSPQHTSPKKRKRPDAERSPLKDVHINQPAKRAGGFLDDSDDDEDLAAAEEHALKRRAIDGTNWVSPLRDVQVDPTPQIASQDEIANPETIPVDELDDIFRSPSPIKPRTTTGSPTSSPNLGHTARLLSGQTKYIPKKAEKASVSYEQLIASRSTTLEGRAKNSYYGIDIHRLMEEAQVENRSDTSHNVPQISAKQPKPQVKPSKNGRTLMWTEKYRAKKFTDLVGDERTHRSVLRWLKGWDSIVFPGSAKIKPKSKRREEQEEQKHRKILLLTGPPGLGKTTLAHVCAKQAGYEVQEINASDERSRDVVKGRVRDMVGTENVRGVNADTTNGKVRKAGKPVCVVVDEVDGVVSGSGGGGEGGFIKALVDLIRLDEKNSKLAGQQPATAAKQKRKGDKFRLLRPLILICNDMYHPSLRPLRQSSFAEIIHIRKPSLNIMVSRVQNVFDKEGIACDSDGARRLCEAIWGVSTKKEGGTGSGTGEGDIRGVMVVSEWVAGRLRASHAQINETPRLTRRWVEENVINDLHHGGGAVRGLGRGGAKDVVDRVFREGAGFPKQAEIAPIAVQQGKKGAIGVAEAAKQCAMQRLREMVDTSGDCDRIVTDCFTAYPEKPFQDDTLLSKPCAAFEWLYFHDLLSSAVHGSQEWELAPYLSQSVLAFHDLFASPRQQSTNQMIDSGPDASFSGPSASFHAAEQQKANRAQLMGLYSSLSLPLARIFRSPEELATEFLPYVLRILSPDVKPVIINSGVVGSKSAATASIRKASEKALVKRAVQAMAATGVRFEKSRVEFDDTTNKNSGWVYRMEPALDQLGAFDTLDYKKEEKVRFAVRSVLESEWKKESARMDAEIRRKRGGQVDEETNREQNADDGETKKTEVKEEKVKRDFFGRVMKEKAAVSRDAKLKIQVEGNQGRIWVSFHEGFSNAVRKPITLDELMRGL
ncbi:hypothetical protein CC78DRAFT_470605 [Lojkania enalia]|uniref:AAA+ ATPase domain-containing protein n=1 Tax=Lojkania enalia TaxID=147567 RepID=A0A9P4N724_9PLEO|nr:hypothetical protein CC78DRAFT_470605 [Didymosphaeria enalia]